MRICYLILLLLSFFVFVQCDEPVRTVMTHAEKKIADSLYAKQVSYVRKDVDSLCLTIQDEMYQRSVDSLMESYIAEIKEIIQGEN